MSYYQGYNHPYNVQQQQQPVSPAVHSQLQAAYTALQAQMQLLSQRCDQLAFLAGQAPNRSPELASRMADRLRNRIRCLLKANRNGNTSCPWHAGRKEKLQYEARMAPQGFLNCGCKETEALLQETLLRYALGSNANRDERLRPELIRGLLDLLERRYGYVDGDFHLDRSTGAWRSGQDPLFWAQQASST